MSLKWLSIKYILSNRTVKASSMVLGKKILDSLVLSKESDGCLTGIQCRIYTSTDLSADVLMKLISYLPVLPIKISCKVLRFFWKAKVIVPEQTQKMCCQDITVIYDSSRFNQLFQTALWGLNVMDLSISITITTIYWSRLCNSTSIGEMDGLLSTVYGPIVFVFVFQCNFTVS